MTLRAETMGAAHRKTSELVIAIADNRPQRARELCEEIVSLMGFEPLDAKPKVAGYTAQSDEKVALVNGFKEDEERLLRKINALLDKDRSVREQMQAMADASDEDISPFPHPGVPEPRKPTEIGLQNRSGARQWLREHPQVDQRWLAIARTHFQEGFMALNRAVFQPQRIKLPGDPE